MEGRVAEATKHSLEQGPEKGPVLNVLIIAVQAGSYRIFIVEVSDEETVEKDRDAVGEFDAAGVADTDPAVQSPIVALQRDTLESQGTCC